MRSTFHDILPAALRRDLAKFGKDLATARRKRRLTIAMMAERTGVSKNTYIRIERGDASVAMGAYAMALFSLGLGAGIGDLADPANDKTGLLPDNDRLPKRVRVKTAPPSVMSRPVKMPATRVRTILKEVIKAVTQWRAVGKKLGMPPA